MRAQLWVSGGWSAVKLKALNCKSPNTLSHLLSSCKMPLKGRRVFVVGVGMTNFTKPRKDPAEGPVPFLF
jgi:hypothetical protein